MQIVHISDTHNRHKQVKIPDCDVLIHSGDISGTGQRGEVENFLKWFKRQPPTYRILIAGNHDRCFDIEKYENREKPEWLLELLEDFKNHGPNYYLENSSCEIEELKIWGSPVTPTFGRDFWAFNKDRGEEINKVWKEIPQETDIVVTHGPVKYKCDYIPSSNEYVGCENLGYHIQRVTPLIHFFGHIHESYGYEEDTSTYYLNGSICNHTYQPINKPWIITIENKQVIKIETYEI